MTSAERTWEIADDFKGTNKCSVTLVQFRAELDAKAAMARRVMDAVRKGDLKACEAAQKAMRKAATA